MSDSIEHEFRGRGTALMERGERIMSLQQANTARIQLLWTNGEVELPCRRECDGHIEVRWRDERVKGLCPAHMVDGVCPLVQHEREAFAQRLVTAGFGPQYHDVDPERLRAREPIDRYLGALVDNVARGRGLILSGDVGVGKTMTMCHVAIAMLRANIGVWNANMPQTIDALMKKSSRQAVVQRLMAVQVLILDDFGAGEMPTWMLAVLEGIVEHRYAHQVPTLLTTNLTKQQLVESDEFRRMVDRWRQTNTFVVLGGTSQRHGD